MVMDETDTCISVKLPTLSQKFEFTRARFTQFDSKESCFLNKTNFSVVSLFLYNWPKIR